MKQRGDSPMGAAQGSVPDDAERPLVDLLLERLERLILDGNLKPGDRLREQALATEWNVSRGPVREACRILQEAGLLEIQPNRGAIVRKVRLEDVLHEFDIRAALWGLAGQEAAASLSHRQMDALEDLIEQMDRVIERDDIDTYITLNTRFHDGIVQSTGNRSLIELQRRMSLQARLFRRQSLITGSGLAQRNADHRDMLAAFRKGDRVLARRLSEDHVLHSKARFEQNLMKAGSPTLRYD